MGYPLMSHAEHRRELMQWGVVGQVKEYLTGPHYTVGDGVALELRQ